MVDDEEKRLNTGVLKPDTDKRYMELKKLIHTRDAFIEGMSIYIQNAPVNEFFFGSHHSCASIFFFYSGAYRR